MSLIDPETFKILCKSLKEIMGEDVELTQKEREHITGFMNYADYMNYGKK